MQQPDQEIQQTPCASGQPVDPAARAPEVAAPTDPVATEDETPGNVTALVVPWLVEELRFHSVLDMGCGDAAGVRRLLEGRFDAHGIDLVLPEDAPPTVKQGDMFRVAQEDGFFDLVICCDVMQEIESHRIPALLGEIDRLSNSYVFIAVPSSEGGGEGGGEAGAREVRWWCDRIADFGWRFRLLREDPETGMTAILCEKPDSLAAKILPLLDQQEAAADAGPRTSVEEPLRAIQDALDLFAAGNDSAAYVKISELAEILMAYPGSLISIQPVFDEICATMERRDREHLIRLLDEDLRRAIRAL